MFFPRLAPRFDVALVDVGSAKPEFRAEAARALGRAETDGDRAAARDAIRLLLDDPVGTVRAAAIEAMGHVGDDGSVAPLERRLREPTAELRQAAVIAIARIGTPESVAALRALVDAESADVRYQAIEALGTLGDGLASEAIATHLADEDRFVREAAVAALSELGAGDHRERIAPLLRDVDASVRREAAITLAKIGDVRAAGELRVALRDRNPPPELFDAVITAGATACIPELRTIAARRFDGARTNLAAAALTSFDDDAGKVVLRRRLRSFFLMPRLEALALIARFRLVGLADEVAGIARTPRGIPVDVIAHTLERLDATTAARDALAFLDERTT